MNDDFESIQGVDMEYDPTGFFAQAALDAMVRADAAYIADLVLWGRTEEADEYATREDVASRIRRWKANR